MAFTYDEVGATASGDTFAGYHDFSPTRVLDISMLATADLLMTWRVHERAGLRVAASSLRAGPGEVVEMRLGPGPILLRAPCRVVYTIDEPDRVGFAYGTPPGHPEAGEELFLLERTGDGTTMTIREFSRPGNRLTALVGPLGRRTQQAMTTRYLRAAARGSH